MAMQYVNYIKEKTPWVGTKKSTAPVLSEEDEKFLDRITKEQNPPPLPPRRHDGDAQVALMDGAQNIALPPDAPGELVEEPLGLQDIAETERPKKSTWSWMRRDSRDSSRVTTAQGLSDIAAGLKTADGETAEEAETRKEEEEMTMMLDRLNLAAVNNRVFSISDETSELLHKFNLVLKDLMNGVPTAYRDLESLLTNGDKQIQKTYNSLPAFLQKLVEKLPDAMTKGIAPEMMAAAAERATGYGINLEKAGKAAGKFAKPPSLQDLLTKPGAITAMLRSIMQFLRTRFPAFAGVNVLWSMALFLLLIVFWYCHKRGKQTRLEKERDLTDQEVLDLEKEWAATHPNETQQIHERPTTTTAPAGATMDQVKAGIIEADAARIAAAAQERSPLMSRADQTTNA